MYLKIKEEDFDTLTDAYTYIQCCTYLLQMMEQPPDVGEEWAFSPLVEKETRSFLLDTLVEQLQRMHPAFLEAYPLRDPPPAGA